MTKKIYYGSWRAGSTFTAKPYEDTNKSRLIKEMREMAKGNRKANEGASWKVWEIVNGEENLIAEGGFNYYGKSWRTNLTNLA